MLKSFRQNPNYLANYHILTSLVLLAINGGLIALQKPDMKDVLWFAPAVLMAVSTNLQVVLVSFVYAAAVCVFRSDFQISLLAMGLPLTVLATFTVTSLIHAASHDSLGPKWFNRLVGELMGVIQLSGLPEWKIIHVLHHQNSDDPVLDPHPPLNKPYWEFAKGMRGSIAQVFGRFFFQCHGQTPESMKSLKRFAMASKLSMLMKICFWFLLLEPQLFTFTFLFSVGFKMLHFAWFNWITHRPVNQSVEIFNKTGPVYKLVNLFSFGLYYHDNHHKAPNLLDPRTMKEKETPAVKQALSA